MSETNLLAALAAVFVYTNTVTMTNWFNTGNSQRRDNTNYVEQWMGEISTTDWREVVTPTVVYVTNRAPLKISRELFSRTNTVIRLTPAGPPPLPPMPGVPTKL